MVVIESEIFVPVPISLCFDCARSVDVHLLAEQATGESAVGEKTTGLLDLGDTVTFEARHLGVRQRLSSKIVEMRRPDRFVDEMQRGAFKFLRHTHLFSPAKTGTVMLDRLEFGAPLGLLGRLAEQLFLKRYMKRFLTRHQHEFCKIAEERLFHD